MSSLRTVAHSVPTRLATACPRLVIYKFTQRIVREEVINLRKEACKVSATSIGLSVEWSLGDVKIFAQLTPQTQKLLADAKKFQTRNGFMFCWSKNFFCCLFAKVRGLSSHPASKAKKTLSDLHAKRT